MRVAILNPSPLHRQAVGGVTRVYGLARFLAERGHDVHVFAQTSGDRQLDTAAIEELRGLNITQRLFPVHRPTAMQKLWWFAGPLPYFVYKRRSPEIQAALREQDLRTPFDIVHVEMAYLAPLVRGGTTGGGAHPCRAGVHVARDYASAPCAVRSAVAL